MQSLCLSPTRELAIQTTRVLQQLAQFSGLQVRRFIVSTSASSAPTMQPSRRHVRQPRLQIVSVIGGVRYTQPIAAQVVVATPGKIQEVLKNRILDLSSLKVRVPRKDSVTHWQCLRDIAAVRAPCTRNKKSHAYLFICYVHVCAGFRARRG